MPFKNILAKITKRGHAYDAKAQRRISPTNFWFACPTPDCGKANIVAKGSNPERCKFCGTTVNILT